MDLFVLFDFYRFGLWFVFRVLISLCSLGWFMMGLGFDFFVLWVDSSWVWVSFGFSVLWLISHRSGLVLISLFFGWFLMGLGFYFSVLWSGFWIYVLVVLQTWITQQFRPDQLTTQAIRSNLKFGWSWVPFLFTRSNRVEYRLTQNLIRSNPWTALAIVAFSGAIVAIKKAEYFLYITCRILSKSHWKQEQEFFDKIQMLLEQNHTMFPDIFGRKDYKDDTTIKPLEIFVVWYPSYPTFLNGKISENLLIIVIRNVG